MSTKNLSNFSTKKRFEAPENIPDNLKIFPNLSGNRLTQTTKTTDFIRLILITI
jgi:hypothetical protein